MEPKTPDVTLVEGAATPTHRCKVCGALWRKVDGGDDTDSGWNLCSKECGECCDNVEMGEQIEQIGVALDPADELEWLREQYAVLKHNNDSLRQAYSTVGQEASTLRRVLAARQPTLRERAAIACMAALTGREAAFGTTYTGNAECAVDAADALIARLANG